MRKKPQTLCSASPYNLPFTRFTRRKTIGPLAAMLWRERECTLVHWPLGGAPGADGLLSAAPKATSLNRFQLHCFGGELTPQGLDGSSWAIPSDPCISPHPPEVDTCGSSRGVLGFLCTCRYRSKGLSCPLAAADERTAVLASLSLLSSFLADTFTFFFKNSISVLQPHPCLVGLRIDCWLTLERTKS